ncbi:F0F1 ATP synthase subunit delta [Lysobacter sp. TY2-98]|uniref:F0F1 ATP synthase subunit delta n=1 Tax=Lysobacter sp. TY2-98 TaxID=2290922 RepID=UPI000E20716D|nr:F0F1 ATP synthase subunit delta [Lysobacter sp. TY2-98]AXK72738.1 F0F1 ATP synthase subunit delta [Lysobacter sp. TY2-98]
MSQALTLARPYARAAFNAARDEGRVTAWSQALAFAARVAADPQAQAVLKHPQLTSEKATRLLAIEGSDASVQRFLTMLADNRRLELLPEIAGLFEQLRAEAERVVKARVTSASQLSDAELAAIRDGLKRRFGREVELESAVDASLIGGAVIDAGDVVIDGSVKGKLERLQSALAA